MLYFLLTGVYHVTPRKDQTNQKKEIVEKDFQVRPLEQRGASPQSIDLVKRCLTKEPAKRPTMK